MDEKNRVSGGLDLDLLENFSVLLDKLVYIVLVVVISALCAYCYTKYMVTPMYHSTAKIYVQNNQTEEYTSSNDISAATQLTQDCLVLITSRSVLGEVISDLGMEGSLSASGLAGMIKATAEDESRVLKIEVEYSNPQVAKQLVDQICIVAQKQLPVLAKVQKVSVTDEGSLPGAPYSPNVSRSVGLTALFALIVVCAVIILMNMINDKVKTPEDAERYLGVSVLGMIPEADTPEGTKKKKRKHH